MSVLSDAYLMISPDNTIYCVSNNKKRKIKDDASSILLKIIEKNNFQCFNSGYYKIYPDANMIVDLYKKYLVEKEGNIRLKNNPNKKVNRQKSKIIKPLIFLLGGGLLAAYFVPKIINSNNTTNLEEHEYTIDIEDDDINKPMFIKYYDNDILNNLLNEASYQYNVDYPDVVDLIDEAKKKQKEMSGIEKYNFDPDAIAIIAAAAYQEQSTIEGVMAETSLLLYKFEQEHNCVYEGLRDEAGFICFLENTPWLSFNTREALYSESSNYRLLPLNEKKKICEAVSIVCDGYRNIPAYVNEHDSYVDLKSTYDENGKTIFVQDEERIIGGEKWILYDYFGDPFGYTSEARRYDYGEYHFEFKTTKDGNLIHDEDGKVISKEIFDYEKLCHDVINMLEERNTVNIRKN